jgi:hypothetical protein
MSLLPTDSCEFCPVTRSLIYRVEEALPAQPQTWLTDSIIVYFIIAYNISWSSVQINLGIVTCYKLYIYIHVYSLSLI